MRYLDSDKIIYIDKSGKRFEMLDFPDLEPVTGELRNIEPIKELDFLSKIFYGLEELWYKIFHANSALIVENNYDIENIRELVIPE